MQEVDSEMDYSRKEIQKKQRQVHSASFKLASKLRVYAFRVGLLLLTAIIITGGIAVCGAVYAMIENAPQLEDFDLIQSGRFPSGYRSVIYDSEGNLIETLGDSQEEQEYVTIDQIPEYVRNCFVAVEDERFYEHNGIDVRGVLEMFCSAFSTGKVDGSTTITQRLLRQLLGQSSADSLYEKLENGIQEQYLVIQLEDRLSKEEILEYYLNTVNFGSGAWGIQAASKEYFNKNVWELTLSEAAVLASASLSPVKQNPVNYPQENEKGWLAALYKMFELGFCTEEEYQAAKEDDVYVRIRAIAAARKETTYSYFVEEVINQVLEALKETGYTVEEANRLLYTGGLSIYTTQDPAIQAICDEVFSDESYFPAVGSGSHYELSYTLSVVKEDGTEVHYQTEDLKGYYRRKGFRDPDGLYIHADGFYFTELGYDREDMLAKCGEFREAVVEDTDTVSGEHLYITLQPQTSMTVIEQSTGYVMAIAGGRGAKTGNWVVNRASGTLRQPGSVFLVPAVYLPALDTAGMTLASVQDDARYWYPDTEIEVLNPTGSYEGLISIRSAISASSYVAAVKTLVQIGPQLGFDYLESLGFGHLVEQRSAENGGIDSDVVPALALGEVTDGVTNLEMTAAYAAIANGGSYIEPVFYTRVLDRDGNVILSNDPQPAGVMKASTAYLLTDAMEEAVEEGSGARLEFRDYEMPVAGMTGSSPESNDLWSVGYTPYYTAAVWSGYDNNRSQTDTTYHQDIWREIMERIHEEKELPFAEFARPDSLTSAVICTKCGKLAVDGLCSYALGGSCAAEELFAKSTLPTEQCSCHLSVKVCLESGKFAAESCPDTETVVYLIKQETDRTKDTPNILPAGDDTMCTMNHAAADGADSDSRQEDEDTEARILWIEPQ